MMTKRDFCEMIVTQFAAENNLNYPNNKDIDWDKYQMQSSRLAVACEYLGLLKDTSYSSGRGGTEFVFVSEKFMKDINADIPLLSTRELIDLLPETC